MHASTKIDNAVVGPSADGGFYLLGVNSFDENLFEGIEWRTKSVFVRLKENLDRQNYLVDVLPVLTDIDDTASLNSWLSIKTAAVKIVKRLLISASLFVNFIRVFTTPFIKDDCFSKRISQKSPPAFN